MVEIYFMVRVDEMVIGGIIDILNGWDFVYLFVSDSDVSIRSLSSVLKRGLNSWLSSDYFNVTVIVFPVSEDYETDDSIVNLGMNRHVEDDSIIKHYLPLAVEEKVAFSNSMERVITTVAFGMMVGKKVDLMKVDNCT